MTPASDPVHNNGTPYVTIRQLKKAFLLHQKPTPYPAMCSIRVFRHELDSFNQRNWVAEGIAVEDTDALVSFCRGSLPRL
jgi:hypothetical protein